MTKDQSGVPGGGAISRRTFMAGAVWLAGSTGLAGLLPRAAYGQGASASANGPLPTTAAPGWVGGYAQSNPAFAYPNPDLSSIPMLGNLDNIPNITRQQKVEWPEFSWLSTPGDSSSRVFQMFAHDISRLGYDDTGRVWSIICPQQGTCSTSIGCLNVEITVTGQRGWVNESTRELAADMTVEGTIWFSPSSHQHPLVRAAWDLFADASLPFPSDKANGIKVTTHKEGSPSEPIFPVRNHQTAAFQSPDFAQHPEAWTVGNVEVEIGPIRQTTHRAVDAFNQKVLDIFNQASGNMLHLGSVLTWNVWFTAPELVDIQEWSDHAEKWRTAIDADHGPSSGPARFVDGTGFEPEVTRAEEFEDFLGMLRALL
ncbi:MAG: hypothetical protein KIS68_08650 [Bauldia sp.]|nr:hypothetical protein [Bauldia sp.]